MANPFATDPGVFLSEAERPASVDCFVEYMRSYTGAWFEALADPDEPDRITASDLVAVTSLSVSVPPRAAVAILRHSSGSGVHAHVAKIPKHDIDQASRGDLDASSHGQKAWALLTSLPGVGSVTAAKLLAAKRPQLIPIWDHEVNEALGPPKGRYWLACWDWFHDKDNADAVRQFRDQAVAQCRRRSVHLPTGAPPTLLRTMDIVIWMRHYGWARGTNGESIPECPCKSCSSDKGHDAR